MIKLVAKNCGRRVARAIGPGGPATLSSPTATPTAVITLVAASYPSYQAARSYAGNATLKCTRRALIVPSSMVLVAPTQTAAAVSISVLRPPVRHLPSRWLSGKGPSSPWHPPLTRGNMNPSGLPLAHHENIYTIPNFLTVGRLAAAPAIGYCIVYEQPAWALSLLAAAAMSDLLDGWIARRWRLHTVVGSILDPMADKVLMTVLTVSLAAQGLLPVWLAVLVLGRDAGLGVAAVYYRWISLPPPKTFARYWDFSLPSAEVRPTTISKYNTFLQLALMTATTAAPVFTSNALNMDPILTAMQYVVAVTTVWSGASYVYSKDAVKILAAKKQR